MRQWSFSYQREFNRRDEGIIVYGACPHLTVAINDLLCMKNAGVQIAMDFSQNEGLAPMAIEKIKILGAVLELPAK